MRFFGLKTCDTCRKALTSLRNAGYDPEVIDVRADKIAAHDLEKIVENFGDAAVNRASTTWRTLSDSERSKPIKDLLEQHPTLLKRPVIDHDGWTQGWKADVSSRFLGK